MAAFHSTEHAIISHPIVAGNVPVEDTGCRCDSDRHLTKLVAVTGGPGAGKTAVLELARRRFCNHVRVLPEVATMLFGGGFPRFTTRIGLESAQRAIASVQREIERALASDGATAVALCDRGTLDGLAYWPGTEDEFFQALGTTRAQQLERYAAVIHLRTPAAEHYDQSNPVRLESAAVAQQMDVRIAAAWRGHSHVHFVESRTDFPGQSAARARAHRARAAALLSPSTRAREHAMTLRLTFLGGAGTVTRSKTLVETTRVRVLVDCGLFKEACS